MENLEVEKLMLENTGKILEKILNKTKEEIIEYEKWHGLFGVISKENELEEMAVKQGNIDQMKGKTLNEITAIVEQL